MRSDRVCIWFLGKALPVAKQPHRSLQRHRLHTWYFDGSHVYWISKKKKIPTRVMPDGVLSVRKISEPRDPVPALTLPSGLLCDLRGTPILPWNVTSSSVK